MALFCCIPQATRLGGERSREDSNKPFTSLCLTLTTQDLTYCPYYYGFLCLAIRVTDSRRCALLNYKQLSGNISDHPEICKLILWTRLFAVYGIFPPLKASNSICTYRSAFVISCDVFLVMECIRHTLWHGG